MATNPTEIDALTRRLITVAEKDLRDFLRVDQLDQELVTTLYLKVRDELTNVHWSSTRAVSLDGAVDDLARLFFLTASAWQSTNRPSAALLIVLRTRIHDALLVAGKSLMH